MNSPTHSKRHPLTWVPSLYFAEGLPFAVVSIMAGFMYKKMGISNAAITYWLSLLGWAWAVKPLWSPFLEAARSKKSVIVFFEALGGISIIVAALTLKTQGFFTFSIACFAITAFASATHDIAADGTYIETLTTHEQSIYSGWLGAFWNAGKLFVQGGLVWLAGELELGRSTADTWTIVLLIPGAFLLILAAYHLLMIPTLRSTERQTVSLRFVATTLYDVISTFFQKPGIWLAIAFTILFRAGEGQVQAVGRLFLIDAKSAGGLGLTTSQVGIAYGTFATLAFVGGSILGGYFADWRGLKKSMFLMILAMNVPNLTFWYLSAYLPTDIYLITAILSLEMLGYGFGFTGLILYMMQVIAPGKYPTAHYALATGIMALGFNLFQMYSGRIQEYLGYHNFFIWCVLSAIPVLALSLIVKIDVKEKTAA